MVNLEDRGAGKCVRKEGSRSKGRGIGGEINKEEGSGAGVDEVWRKEVQKGRGGNLGERRFWEK